MAMMFVCLDEVTVAELVSVGFLPTETISYRDQLWAGCMTEAETAQRALRRLSGFGADGDAPLEWSQVAGVDYFLLSTRRVRTQEEPAPLKQKHKTILRSWFGCVDPMYRERVIRLLNTYLVPAVRRDVNLWVPHNTTRDPIYGPEFNVFVWASPTPPDEDWTPPERAFGYTLPARQGNRFGRWAEGIQISSPEGEEVAALDGNNLFIYYDAVHAGGELEFHAFEQLIGAALKALATASDTFDPVEAKKAYIELCGKRLALQIRQNETKIATCRTDIVEIEKQLAGALRAMTQLQADAVSLSGAAAAGEAKFGQEFDSLLKIPKIQSVAFRGSLLVIGTKVLRAKNPANGQDHEIGKFKFVVDTERGTVKILNQTRLIDGYRAKMQAPHVFPDGRPCLGSLEVTVPQLVAAYEFSALSQILIAYIESVNLDDGAGRYIEHWPRIRDDGQLVHAGGGRYETKISSLEEMRQQTAEALAAYTREQEARPAQAEQAAAPTTTTAAPAADTGEIELDPARWVEEG